MLPCQHTFCLTCLQSHVMAKDMLLRQTGPSGGAKSRRFLQCPTCSQKHLLENGVESVEALPVNMYIVSLLKLLEKNSPSAAGGEYVFESRCVKCQMACEKHKLVCQHCLQVMLTLISAKMRQHGPARRTSVVLRAGTSIFTILDFRCSSVTLHVSQMPFKGILQHLLG